MGLGKIANYSLSSGIIKLLLGEYTDYDGCILPEKTKEDARNQKKKIDHHAEKLLQITSCIDITVNSNLNDSYDSGTYANL